MKEETNRYLWEKLFGKCWHEVIDNPNRTTISRCNKCGRSFNPLRKVLNPDFFDKANFIDLWEKCREQEWWGEFAKRYAPPDTYFKREYEGYIDDDLIDPLTFPTRVREFMEGRE